jgi:single-strand DNA-binding protein
MKHIGMARLGRDAEMRYTPSGDAVANLSLAVTIFDKTAEHNRGTQWIDASLWGKQAEALVQYMVKGSLHCFTLSDLRLETYQKTGGGEGSKITARVDSVELGPRQDSGSVPAERQAPPARQNGTGPATPRPAPRPAPNFSDDTDDIPF